MADKRIRPALGRLASGAAIALITVTLPAPGAEADAGAYLINVTVRPGYNFANRDAALEYGQGICRKVARGDGYANIMADVKADFRTSDEFQASYLITQAVNELCPAQIWRLRNSAACYRPPGT